MFSNVITNLRLTAVFICIVGYYVAFLGLRLLFFFSRRYRVKVRSKCLAYWAKSVMRILNMQLRVEGPLPPPGSVLVCNHLSYMDIVIMFSVLQCVFISKSDVRNWSLLGKIVADVGTLFMNRTSAKDLLRVRAHFERVFANGDVLVFFPEGTSTNGTSVQRFFPGLFAEPAENQRDVYCASLSYHHQPGGLTAQDAVCWWGDAEFLPHLRQMLSQPGFTAVIRFSEKPFSSTDRKQLAEETHREITRLFIPSGSLTDS